MKKFLVVFLCICAAVVYGIYVRLTAKGWTIFSHAETTQKEEVVKVEATSTPLLFTGDIMLGRYVETLANVEGDELRSFEQVKSLLKSHITIANLEGPIPDIHVPTLINGMRFSFSSSTPSVLKEGGVKAVSLANNHMFDYGVDGYEQTKRSLDNEHVFHFGGYAPTQDDYFETHLGTTTVIVYGITMIATGWDEQQALFVTQKLRSEHPSAHLIAFLHWGDEYKTQNTYQRDFAHKLIDLGVDAIIGSHPHVVQGIEVYQGKPIFYSLGNFIFDQYWKDSLEDGLAIELTETDSSYIYTLLPVHSDRSVPFFATSTKRDQILTSISSQSSGDLKEQILFGRLSIIK